MYKVFIENRAVEFVNSQKIHPHLSCIDACSIQSIEADLRKEFVGLNPNQSIILSCDDCQKEWERLFQFHQFVHAAGGLVMNENKCLIISRFGMLDLPKGHLDLNEVPEIAAAREIFEECGISPLKKRSFICSTFHTYFYDQRSVLKQTDWFLFDYNGLEKGQPQIEEGIDEIHWMDFSEIHQKRHSFYTSIQFVLDEWQKNS